MTPAAPLTLGTWKLLGNAVVFEENFVKIHQDSYIMKTLNVEALGNTNAEKVPMPAGHVCIISSMSYNRL